MSWTNNEKQKINQIEQSVSDLREANDVSQHMAARAEQLSWEHGQDLKEIRDALTGGLKSSESGIVTQVNLNTNFRLGFRKIYLSIIGSTIFVIFMTAWVTFKAGIINFFKGALNSGPPSP